MPWLKLSITTDEKNADSVADFLELYGATAVSFSAASDEKLFEQFGQEQQVLWQSTEVSGLLPHDVDMDILLVCLRDKVGAEAIQQRSVSTVDDKDWIEDYQRSVAIQWYGSELCICPSWLTPPKTKIPPIVLDPGLAFGTGSHCTTKLCLEWLSTLSLTGKTVIDYGCGSGILALAALRLGAEHVYAIDIDPQAITATLANAEKNSCAESISVGLPGQFNLPEVPVLVANLLLNPLVEMAEPLAALVRQDGVIGLSGLLAHQSKDCLASYQPWFNMQSTIVEQEWAFVSGSKR